MAYTYDPQNIFAKILRGEIPNDTVLDTEYSFAFRDIQPQAPSHVLVIPKGPYVSYDHFAAEASDAEIVFLAVKPQQLDEVIAGIAEVAEGLSTALALAALVVASGFFRGLWETIPDV